MNKKAIIVGASSGIGLEVAKLLLSDGWQLGIAARREELLQTLKAKAPERIEIMTIDVTKPDAGEKLQTLIGQLGGMDLYFHASGIGKQNRSLEPDIELSTMETNAVGFTRMIGSAYRYFAKQGKGHIAAITSIAGTKGLGPAPAYSATKAMQATYIQALEQQAHQSRLDIRFTDIRPGFVDTALLSGTFKYPMLMKPEAVAREIVKSINKKGHIQVIDIRYRVLTFFWRLVPNCIWRRMTMIFMAALLLGSTAAFASYTANDDNAASQYEQVMFIPQAPDYNDAAMWVTADGDTDGTGADIFYVVSTWEEDWTTEDGRICHYADVWNPEHRGRMGDLEINKVATYMSPGNRFYAPFYRHTTIEAWMTQNEDTIRNRTRLAMGDVCAAFDHFQAHRDKSRPLIIAGFSQGGLAVVELLKHIDDETYSQLAAAYVLGYKVTNADMAQCSHIRPAEGETDTGVTICYNTVKDVKYVIPVISASDICINPVNWRTDATPATLHDTITITVAPSHHVLVVSGYSGSEYAAYKGFINVGDIHSCEPWLYSECLAKNIKVRTKEWRKHE